MRALGALSEAPAPEHAHLASLLDLGVQPEPAVYTDLFVFQLYPYASIYLGADGMLGGEARDRIAGFWTAIGRRPPSEPDHLGTLLGLYAGLTEAEAVQGDTPEALLLREARRTLLTEHIVSWTGPYLQLVSLLGPPFYREWAELTMTTLSEEVDAVCGQTFTISHFTPDLVLRDPREVGGAPFLDDLLAPARSGMIVPRAELARASQELGLGFRLGERAYQLKALFSQDPERVLAWLVGLADRWCGWHRERRTEPSPIQAHWTERARASRALLRELLSERWEDGAGHFEERDGAPVGTDR